MKSNDSRQNDTSKHNSISLDWGLEDKFSLLFISQNQQKRDVFETSHYPAYSTVEAL